MNDPIGRRELIGAAGSALAGLLSGCGPSWRTEVVQTPEGKVLKWERDDLLVLVSGLQERYRLGGAIQLKVMLNNQSGKLGQYRVRTKLAGRGDQVVVEAPVATLGVKAFDAGEVERSLALGDTVSPGDYTLVVELPPWSLEGKVSGSGATIGAPVHIDR